MNYSHNPVTYFYFFLPLGPASLLRVVPLVDFPQKSEAVEFGKYPQFIGSIECKYSKSGSFLCNNWM